MATRRVFAPRARTAGPQPTQVDSSQANLAATFANTMWGLTQEFTARAEENAREEGKLQGLIAGQDPAFRPSRENTVRSRAMNQAAAEVYLSNLEISAHRQIEAISNEHRGNPAKMQGAVEGLGKAMEQTLNRDFPELAQPFRQMVSRLSRPYLMRAAEQHRDALDKQVAASTSQMLLENQKASAHLARTAGLDPIAIAGLTTHRARFAATLAKHGPREGYTFSGVEMPPDPNRVPLFSVADMDAAMLQFDREMQTQAALGGLESALENNRGLQFITQFRSLPEIQRLYNASPQELDKLEVQLIQHMSRRQSAETSATAAQTAARKEVQRVQEQAVTAEFLETGTFSQEKLALLTANDLIDNSFAASMIQHLNRSGPLTDDPTAVALRRVDLLSSTEQEILTDPAITRDTAAQLILDRRKLIEDKANWRNSQNGKEAVRRIAGQFGVLPGALNQHIAAKEARRMQEALTAHFEAVQALPLEQREARAIEEAEKVVRRIRTDQFTSNVTKREDKLLTNPMLLFEGVQYTSSAQLMAEKDTSKFQKWGPGDRPTDRYLEMLSILQEEERLIERDRKRAEKFSE